MPYIWKRFHVGGYEVSTRGDSRFSAFAARMNDGRTIEEWYQCDVKGYDVGGTNWRLGKGKPAKNGLSKPELYERYRALWEEYFRNHPNLLEELKSNMAESRTNVLTDCFASSNVNQARALAEILNKDEWNRILLNWE